MERILKVSRREKIVRNVYIVAFVLLFVCYIVTLYANRELVKQSERVEHTNKVIKTLDNIQSKVVDGETGMRGYLITRDSNFLQPYFGSEQKVDSLFDSAGKLIADNPVQHERLEELKKNIKRRFEILRLNLESFSVHNQTITDTMDKLQAQGKKLMDTIRAQTFLMGAYEKELLAEREQKMKKTTSAITIITIISLTIVLSLLFFGFITYMQVSRQRKKAEQDILEYQRELNKRIADLDEANAELIKMRGQEKFAVTGRIARTIGHEVRNPLTNILLATDQLKLEIDQAERDKNYLFEMIERNSARINQLISDLLDSTKFSELNYEKITVNDLLTETIEHAADRIELSNIKLLQDTREGGNCSVSVDKSKMKIALLNIITNAIEAMHGREGSELIITTAEGPDRCEIRIEDNGPGMDDETLSKLFEAYYTTKIKGNGLGLTNTQNIILNHKGDIVVESEKGKGTRFRIFLNKNN